MHLCLLQMNGLEYSFGSLVLLENMTLFSSLFTTSFLGHTSYFLAFPQMTLSPSFLLFIWWRKYIPSKDSFYKLQQSILPAYFQQSKLVQFIFHPVTMGQIAIVFPKASISIYMIDLVSVSFPSVINHLNSRLKSTVLLPPLRHLEACCSLVDPGFVTKKFSTRHGLWLK